MVRNIKTVRAAQGLHVIGKLGPDFEWAVCHPAHTISFSSLAYTRCLSVCLSLSLSHTHTHKCGNSFLPTLWDIFCLHLHKVSCFSSQISTVWKVGERRFSEFRPFVITHFNALVSGFRDCIGRIGMRPLGWRVGFSHQCYYSRSRSVSLIEVGLHCALCQGAVIQSFNVLCAHNNSSCFMKCEISWHFMRFEGISCFYCRYFMNSWNQVGVWRWKWIPMCMIPVFVIGFCRSSSRTSRFLSLDADSPLVCCIEEYQHLVSIRIARWTFACRPE